MSLALRVIPCLDVDAGRVVKGVNFENLRDAGDPVDGIDSIELQGVHDQVEAVRHILCHVFHHSRVGSPNLRHLKPMQEERLVPNESRHPPGAAPSFRGASPGTAKMDGHMYTSRRRIVYQLLAA